MTPSHVRSQRARNREKFERGAKLWAICALRLRGAFALLVIEGSFDQVVFDHYAGQSHQN